jgi:hypothetical protein
MRYALLFLFLLGLNPVAGAERAEVERWRKEYEGKLFSDPRLMAVGRFELREGKQSVGSGPTNSLVLPAGPAALATVELHGKTAQIALQPGVTGTYTTRPQRKQLFQWHRLVRRSIRSGPDLSAFRFASETGKSDSRS